MPKVLTTAQIEEQKAQGVEFSTPPERREVSLEGLELVVEHLRSIAEANQKIAEKRHQDIVDAINRLASMDKGVDMTPVIEAVRQSVMPPVAYTHEVERNNRGLISNIKSVPVKTEIH